MNTNLPAEVTDFIIELIIANIDKCIDKIKSRKLNDVDYEMIISHLEFYKSKLVEAQKNGNND